MQRFSKISKRAIFFLLILPISSLLSASAFAAGEVAAPINIQASVPSVGQIKVSFSPTTTAPQYYVKCSEVSGYYYGEATGTSSPITVTQGIKLGNIKYSCTVAALSSSAQGTASVSSNKVNPSIADKTVAVTAPGVPSGVYAVAGNASVTISWNPPAFDGGSPILNYIVSTNTSISDTAAQKTVPAYAGGGSLIGGLVSYTYTGLTNGTPYTFYIRSVNAVGQSGWANNNGSVTPKESINPSITDGPGNTTGTGGGNILPIEITIKNPLKSANDLSGLASMALKAITDLLFPIVVIMLLYCGFLFVTAQGNTEKLGAAKNALLYTVIGAAIVLGAYGLIQIVASVISSMAK